MGQELGVQGEWFVVWDLSWLAGRLGDSAAGCWYTLKAHSFIFLVVLDTVIETLAGVISQNTQVSPLQMAWASSMVACSQGVRRESQVEAMHLF